MIAPDQKRAFDEDGVVCLRRVFEPHWLEVCGRAIDFGGANPGPTHLHYSRQTKPGSYETDFLERRYGVVESGPYRYALLPTLWRSDRRVVSG